jgi:hypothetical protein
MSKSPLPSKQELSSNRMTDAEIKEFLARSDNASRFKPRDIETEKLSDFVNNTEQLSATLDEIINLSPEKRDVEIRPPPLFAEFCAAITTRPKMRERVLGSRQECFGRDARKFGRRWAVSLYWLDTFKSLWPSLIGLGRYLLAGDILHRWWRS